MVTHNAVRKLMFLLAAAMLVPAGVTTASAGISGEINRMFNARWNYDLDGSNKYLTYGSGDNSFTKLSGSFVNKRTGLALGAHVDINTDDNAVGKADSMMGYLGYKRTYLRYQRGSMNGTYHWDGAVVPGMNRDGKFAENLTHVDLLFWKPRLLGVPGFIGLGYTSFAMPAEVQTLYTNSDKAHQKNGVFVYDPDFKATFYSFLFGFDTFSETLANMEGALSAKKGFGVYISAEDRIGFGSSQMGKDAVKNASTLNPGRTPVTDSFFAAIIENDTSLGLRWFSANGKVGIGVGYELSLIANFNFEGAATKPGELGFDIYASMMRHGPVARLLVKW